MRRNYIIACLIALFSIVAVAAEANKLKVVTTLNLLRYLTEEIGKDKVQVLNLSDPEQDPHFVQPRPTLMKRARDAQALIDVGLDLEPWVQKIVEGSGNPLIQTGQPGRLSAAQGVSALEVPLNLSREFGDLHPYGNPHVWLDPLMVKKMAANIANMLQRLDPANASFYAVNLASFQMQIDNALFGEQLVKEVGSAKLVRLAEQDQLMGYLESHKLMPKLGGWLKRALPLKDKQMVTQHRSWSYFGKRFSIGLPIEIEEKPGIQPSPKHRDRVIQLMNQNKISLILVEPFFDRTAADFIAAKTGAKVIIAPLDIGSSAASKTYFQWMDQLLDKMVK